MTNLDIFWQFFAQTSTFRPIIIFFRQNIHPVEGPQERIPAQDGVASQDKHDKIAMTLSENLTDLLYFHSLE